MAYYNEILAGLKVFADRGEGNEDGVSATRDEIFIGWDTSLTDDEKITLTSAGWRYDVSSKCWVHTI